MPQKGLIKNMRNGISLWMFLLFLIFINYDIVIAIMFLVTVFALIKMDIRIILPADVLLLLYYLMEKPPIDIHFLSLILTMTTLTVYLVFAKVYGGKGEEQKTVRLVDEKFFAMLLYLSFVFRVVLNVIVLYVALLYSRFAVYGYPVLTWVIDWSDSIFILFYCVRRNIEFNKIFLNKEFFMRYYRWLDWFVDYFFCSIAFWFVATHFGFSIILIAYALFNVVVIDTLYFTMPEIQHFKFPLHMAVMPLVALLYGLDPTFCMKMMIIYNPIIEHSIMMHGRPNRNFIKDSIYIAIAMVINTFIIITLMP
ncbi:MAG: hypothetical protein Q6363_008500 [Candidatus Njordarchaeota archaeon]